MSILAEHVVLTITQDTVGISRAGFGTPLILSHNATFPERVRFYSDLPSMVTDGFASTSPEYRAARAILSQSPHPVSLAVGRAASLVTQVYTLNVTTVRNSYKYQVKVKGPGMTDTTAEYTSDASATDGEIVVGLVAAINAVTSNNYIAAGATSPFTVTADAAGGWFSLEVVNPADLKIEQTHLAPAGTTLANDLDAIQLENSNWYALVTLYNSDGYVKDVAAWVEAADSPKIYACDLSNSETATLADGGGDTADDLQTLAYGRTFVCYHPSPADMFGAAWLGRVLPLDPGSETWKFKTLSGVNPVTSTSTHRTNIRAKKANTYQTVAGRNITWEGTMCDGDFVDTTRGIDWLEDDMTKAVFAALARADKIPYTNAGVALIENEIRGSLSRAVNAGILSDDPAPVITVPKVADVASSDRALRLLPDVKWSGTLQGAIHKVEISGVISV